MKTFSYLQKQHKLQARNAMQRNMYKWQNNYKYAKIFNLNAKLVINYSINLCDEPIKHKHLMSALRDVSQLKQRG